MCHGCNYVFPNFQHRFKLLTSQRIRSIMRCNDIENIQRYDFPRILQERVPGTPGHEEVKEVSSHVLCVLAVLTGCCVTQYIDPSKFALVTPINWNAGVHLRGGIHPPLAKPLPPLRYI